MFTARRATVSTIFTNRQAFGSNFRPCRDQYDEVQFSSFVLQEQASATPVCIETLRHVMEAVTRSIAAEMSERFGLIIDGRIHDSEHFIAVFPWYETDDALVELLPSVASKRRLRQLLGEQKDVESVSKELQGDNVNLLNFRVWFEGLIALKPPYEHYLIPISRLDACNCYEAKRMTCADKTVLERFRDIPNGIQEAGEDVDSALFVGRLQKHQRPEEQQSKYDLLGSIPPTSNGAEQFFSVARTTFGPQRHSQLSYTLGMLLFLRENADF
uniref:HAT C-terminal dimerisation domain-containing protein n=1 Tax=Phytophthora ramorum TaxID=164328 RepID=H3GLE9_PHYRM